MWKFAPCILMILAAGCGSAPPAQDPAPAKQIAANGKASSGQLDSKWRRSKFANETGVEAAVPKKGSPTKGETENIENSDEVVLKRQPDGHFYAEATVNGSDVRFLIDTGATGIALTAADADAIGLNWRNQPTQPIGRGANGVIMGMPVKLNSVSLGDFKSQGLPAVVIPEGLDVSLLGQSFLSSVPNVSIANNEMKLQ
jgi:aspartyl protease family protein